jgi:hypothetical protein
MRTCLHCGKSTELLHCPNDNTLTVDRAGHGSNHAERDGLQAIGVVAAVTAIAALGIGWTLHSSEPPTAAAPTPVFFDGGNWTDTRAPGTPDALNDAKSERDVDFSPEIDGASDVGAPPDVNFPEDTAAPDDIATPLAEPAASHKRHAHGRHRTRDR